MQIVDQFADRNDDAANAAMRMATEASASADKAAEKYAELQAVLGRYTRQLETAATVLNAQRESQDAATDATEKAAGALEMALYAAGALDDDYRSLAIASELAADRARDLGDAEALAAGALGMTSASVERLRDADVELAAAQELAASSAATLAHADASAALAADALADAELNVAKAAVLVATAERFIDDQAKLLVPTVVSAADTFGAFAASARDVNSHLTASFRGWGNIIHWVIAFGSELAAVLIPAMVAFGSAMFTGAQGAQNMENHLTSLWDAAEATGNMFHETMGQALGLKDVLQKAQNAADPDVYQILGAAVNGLKEHFGDLAGIGLQVIQIFDTFAAKVDVDLRNGLGNTVDNLLSQMVPDLVRIGQIFGNLGHAILNFAQDMPGLAQVLLGLANAFSRVILWVSKLPHWLITTFMAMEEAYRWGGVLNSVVLRLASGIGKLGTLGLPILANILAKLGTVFQSLGMGLGVFLGNIGKVMSAIPGFRDKTDAAGESVKGLGSKVSGLGADMNNVIKDIPAWQIGLGAVAAGAVAYFTVKEIEAKDAVEQTMDAMEKTISTASNMTVISTIAGDMGKLSDSMLTTSKNAAPLTLNMNAMKNAATAMGSADVIWGTDQAKIQATFRGMAEKIGNVTTGTLYLAKAYHTSLTGAMTLATQAGVQLTNKITGQAEPAEVLRQKIANLVQGYKDMGQPAGEVGKDMTAIAMSSSLQSSKLDTLNQAWDQFMQNLTGGTSTVAQFEQSLTGLTTGTDKIKNILGSSGSVTLSVKSFADSLQSFTGKGAQAWQNFDQVIGSTAPQLIDWLRTAGTEGELSGTKFSQGVRDMVAQLEPFASKSAAAKAELIGLAQEGDSNITTWKSLTGWLNQGHESVGNLGDIISTTTGKMSNMAQVAQNLGSVLNNDIIQTMDSARVSGSNLNTVTEAYTQSLQKNGAQSATTHTDYKNLVSALYSLTGTNQQANNIARTYARSLGDDTEQAHSFNSAAKTLNSTLQNMKSKALDIEIRGYGAWRVTGAAGPTEQGHKGEPGMAKGGIAEGGTWGKDSIHALLMPGEGVLTTRAVSMIGAETVHHLNRMAESGAMHALHRFAAGGIVPSYSGSVTGESPWARNDYNATISDFASSLASSFTQSMSAGGPTPTGSGGTVEALMKSMAASIGWTGAMWDALYNVEMREAGFNLRARNPSSGAYGLAQFINGPGEYAQYGGNANTAAGQIIAMLRYIMERYGNPEAAWVSELTRGYYDNGGPLHPGWTLAFNGTGSDEMVTPGAGRMIVEVHNTVQLDGKTVYRSVQQQALQHARRNQNNGLNLTTRGR